MSSVDIPDSVTIINDSAFTKCGSLTSIALPGKLAEIKNWAFSKCTGLTSLTIPDSLKAISSTAFYQCMNLVRFEVSDSNPNWQVRDGVLFSKDGSKLIICPAGFKNHQYTIPENVTMICASAFRTCTGIASITIPDGVSVIEEFAFSECSHLSQFDVFESSQYLMVQDGILFSKDGKTVIAYPNGAESKEYVIPEKVAEIGNGAFCGSSNLTSVTIPNSVTNIGEFVFSDCTGLKSVSIPNSVTDIGEWAFCECTGLTSLTIADGVDSLGKGMFAGCTGLTSVTIPNSVENIGDFAFSSCTSLKSVLLQEGLVVVGEYTARQEKYLRKNETWRVLLRRSRYEHTTTAIGTGNAADIEKSDRNPIFTRFFLNGARQIVANV